MLSFLLLSSVGTKEENKLKNSKIKFLTLLNCTYPCTKSSLLAINGKKRKKKKIIRIEIPSLLSIVGTKKEKKV